MLSARWVAHLSWDWKGEVDGNSHAGIWNVLAANTMLNTARIWTFYVTVTLLIYIMLKIPDAIEQMTHGHFGAMFSYSFWVQTSEAKRSARKTLVAFANLQRDKPYHNY